MIPAAREWHDPAMQLTSRLMLAVLASFAVIACSRPTEVGVAGNAPTAVSHSGVAGTPHPSASSMPSASDAPAPSTPDATDDPAFALYGDQCPAYQLSPRRCAFIVRTLAEQAGVELADATDVVLLGDPGCGDPDPNVICTRTTSFVVRARFSMADGRTAEESVFCGVGTSWLCEEAPEIRDPTMEGYHDIPCPGEPPQCPSPLPTIDPDAANRAEPLRVDDLDIPIDHLGDYDVVLGEATLPNGILTEKTLHLVDPRPTDFHLDGGLEIDLVSLDDGKPLDGYWMHSWRDGTEQVAAHLLFTVIDLLPGAVLQVQDVEVR